MVTVQNGCLEAVKLEGDANLKECGLNKQKTEEEIWPHEKAGSGCSMGSKS